MTERRKPEGYFTFTSPTYNVFVFWRAFRDKKLDPYGSGKGLVSVFPAIFTEEGVS